MRQPTDLSELHRTVMNHMNLTERNYNLANTERQNALSRRDNESAAHEYGKMVGMASVLTSLQVILEKIDDQMVSCCSECHRPLDV